VKIRAFSGGMICYRERMNRIPIALIASLLFPIPGLVRAEGKAQSSCEYDRARLLALKEAQFDQDMAGGWRALANRAGCELAAADLLRDYRKAHRNEAGLLVWHEAQLRAFAGQSREAIALMNKSRQPAKTDRAGWNPYVDATIAFLRRDRPALEKARAKLASVPPPPGADMPPVIDGYMELDFADGQKRKIRWPPNIDVVEGLLHCFDKPYVEAYRDECRVRAR
jgi:predicted NUDIX family NTP pyrophosphohydrolase